MSECVDGFGAKYYEGNRPWHLKCDLAFPCATLNELEEQDAKALVKNGCIAIYYRQCSNCLARIPGCECPSVGDD